MEQPGSIPVPGSLVSRSAVTAATLVYSAPTPGCGSRYLDGRVPHEARVLSAFAAGETLAAAEGGVLPGQLERADERRYVVVVEASEHAPDGFP